MNGLHDPHVHKRTSITELLNPITSPPSYSNHNKLPPISAYIGSSHAQHTSPPGPAYPPGPIGNGPTYSLRAADWNSGAKEDGPPRHPGSDSPCRYASSSVSSQTTQLYGPDPYSRLQPRIEQASNYGIAGPAWSPSHDAASVSYGVHVVPPTYPDERLERDRPIPPRNYSPQQYPQEMLPHPYIVNGSFPFAFTAPAGGSNPVPLAWQASERASVRIAARGSVPPMQTPPPRDAIPAQAYYPGFNIGFAPMPFAPPPMVQRRPADVTEEETAAPKAKKARTKAKTTETNGSSRRGYNAKKRSEAAQIAQTNAQLAAAGESGGKEADGTNSVQVTVEGQSDLNVAGPLVPELQFARCMSNRYRADEFPRCVSCTRRWAGDTCRFQGIRFFLKNQDRLIVGISFVESQKPDAPSMNFPSKWNVELDDTYLYRVKRTVARALLPTLRTERDHLDRPQIIRRPRESEVRATCDTCMTSIFSSSWMCRMCGREACSLCYALVEDLTKDCTNLDQKEAAALQVRRDRHLHTNPFFLACTRRNEHTSKDFSPMSRFCREELEQAIIDMEKLLSLEPGVDLPEFDSVLDADVIEDKKCGDAETPNVETGSDLTSVGTPSTQTSHTSPAPPSSKMSSGEIPSHETERIADADLNDESFRKIWRRGAPLIVTGVLPKFTIDWSPEYFKNKYGTQNCLIVECQSDTNRRVTVGDFFSWFGNYEGRRDCWKLKDWPPSTDFKTAFPELYEDFVRATPVPNYVRRDGVLNLASHFPTNTVAPDLGPKMYNAMASFESEGSKGSTRLHMDMADAVNIMLFAAPMPNGEPGCAAWDIFRAEDTSKLRKFLKRKFKGQYQHDPIHSQNFFLDTVAREELYRDTGIKSHRIYQYPGEAVFIPAGCAHQVCNLADCIKVASDFVSPENVARCEALTQEFREQNQSNAWKEDVLQLRTMMWFAWLSCCRKEKEREKKESD
ncbi:hypothetical protein OBBRIDRAFT_797392 [Obba rivulosa]|uniref:JmjC domain-containing protein n=1 Tax=Obba rivulosa TaxID=1052685 RepID=A0A8E2AL77_9APHY|nr:hypothetical protein OBBRIDRAFT_797392 [Obba rivulosa]